MAPLERAGPRCSLVVQSRTSHSCGQAARCVTGGRSGDMNVGVMWCKVYNCPLSRPSMGARGKGAWPSRASALPLRLSKLGLRTGIPKAWVVVRVYMAFSTSQVPQMLDTGCR